MVSGGFEGTFGVGFLGLCAKSFLVLSGCIACFSIFVFFIVFCIRDNVRFRRRGGAN